MANLESGTHITAQTSVSRKSGSHVSRELSGHLISCRETRMLDETLDVGAAPYYNERVHGSSIGSVLRTEQGRETHSVKSSASCFRPDHGKEFSTKSITTSDEEAKKPSPTETPEKKRRIVFTLRPRESSSVQSKKWSTTNWRSWLSPTDDTSTLDLLRPSYKEGAVETFFRFFYVVLFLGFGTLVVTILWMKLHRRTEFTLETYFGRFQGRVQTLEGESVYAFLGVPFGELKGPRFARAAAYVPPMNGTVPHHPGVRCPQPKEGAPLNYTDQLRQENCLYLNIWSPASGCHISVEPCSGVRTVLLFLFSVGFSRGGGDWYDGSAFAAVGGVVVVAPNYRLGLLAFGLPVVGEQLFWMAQAALGMVVWSHPYAFKEVPLLLGESEGHKETAL